MEVRKEQFKVMTQSFSPKSQEEASSFFVFANSWFCFIAIYFQMDNTFRQSIFSSNIMKINCAVVWLISFLLPFYQNLLYIDFDINIRLTKTYLLLVVLASNLICFMLTLVKALKLKLRLKSRNV